MVVTLQWLPCSDLPRSGHPTVVTLQWLPCSDLPRSGYPAVTYPVVVLSCGGYPVVVTL